MNTEEIEGQGNEESSLAESFDSGAFMDTDTMGASDDNAERMDGDDSGNSGNDEEEAGQQEEGNSDEGNSEEDESSDWGDAANTSNSQESGNGSEEEGEGEDDGASSDAELETSNEGWETIAESLGIDADNYESFIDTLKNQQSLAAQGATNEKITGLNQLIGLEDETLMRKELKARGFDSDEIEDEIDIMIENNTIRSEARRVRKDLEGVIANEKAAMATSTQEVDATQQQEQEQAAAEIKEHMSKTSEMFGGRINSKQKESHAEYVTSGAFFDEISSTPENLTQAAWLWKYKDQILNGQRSAGMEKGKSAILDKMVNPETQRRTHIPDPESGEFNPNRFIDSETL
jgi:hypothetical protein